MPLEHRDKSSYANRYKSILCQENPFLKELVRYIHLNPLQAGLVADCKSLRKFLPKAVIACLPVNAAMIGKMPNIWCQFERRYRYRARGYDFNWLVDQAASLFGL
jgi:hypothetical protein